MLGLKLNHVSKRGPRSLDLAYSHRKQNAINFQAQKSFPPFGVHYWLMRGLTLISMALDHMNHQLSGVYHIRLEYRASDWLLFVIEIPPAMYPSGVLCVYVLRQYIFCDVFLDRTLPGNIFWPRLLQKVCPVWVYVNYYILIRFSMTSVLQKAQSAINQIRFR